MNNYRWQRARILKDDEHPHLVGLEVWVESGKPRLYPTGKKGRRVKLVLSNLRSIKDPFGQMGHRPRNIERVGFHETDFAPVVPYVPSEEWTKKDWKGVRDFNDWGRYALPEGWTCEIESDRVPKIEGEDILAGWGNVQNLPKIGPIDLGTYHPPVNPKTRYGRELLHSLRRLQQSAQRAATYCGLGSEYQKSNHRGG